MNSILSLQLQNAFINFGNCLHSNIRKECSSINDLTTETLFSCMLQSFSAISVSQVSQVSQVPQVREEFDISILKKDIKNILYYDISLIETITTKMVKHKLIDLHPSHEIHIKTKQCSKLIETIYSEIVDELDREKNEKDIGLHQSSKQSSKHSSRDPSPCNKKELEKIEKVDKVEKKKPEKQEKKREKKNKKEIEYKPGQVCFWNNCETKCKKIRVLKDGKVYCGKHHAAMEKKLN